LFQPSRELAEQTFNQIGKFRTHLGAPVVTELLVVGGVNVKDQIAALKAGVDIVVATPG
jgi:superfamily II DNA/RNA helicase